MNLRNRNNKPKFSKIIVVVLLAAVAVFTVAMTAIFCVVGSVPDSLVTAFFAFAAGEAGFLGLIKHGETRYMTETDTEPKG